MRYNIVIREVRKPTSTSISTTKTNIKTFMKNNVHFYDEQLLDKCDQFSRMFVNMPGFSKEYRNIKRLLHPFDTIKRDINSRLLNSPARITNAFMKFYEFIDVYYNYVNFSDNTIKMFDVAGAPGMFVIAMDYHLNSKYKNLNLQWHACSLEGGTALSDSYGLYKNNPSCYSKCDVTNENDLKNILSSHSGSYNLVTGDIGMYHDENDTSILQEVTHLDVQWGQAILALNLAAPGAVMFLKMYTLLTMETTYLLDILSEYFEEIQIVKPYTSRILNLESYIVCIHRNKKPLNPISLRRIPFEEKEIYVSPNLENISTFESARFDYRILIGSLVCRIVNENNKISEDKMMTNTQYRAFHDKRFTRLEEIFKRLR